MRFEIGTDWGKVFYTEPVIKPVIVPELKPQETNDNAKIAEVNFVGANNKVKLQKIAADKPTPYGALDQIDKLPKPDPTAPQAVKAYKAQCKQIADNAIKNSEPPKLSDYDGLNGRTREYEYSQSKQYYDSQISRLKKISDEAARNPDKIITPAEAVNEIGNLPRPDRSNPQSNLDYNNKRAQIASDALLYAAPPKIEDYKGNTAQYNQDKAAYDQTIKQLTTDSYAQGSTLPPPMTETEINTAADSYIKNHNGVKNEDDGYGVGKDLASLAKTDPSAAAAIMKKVQEKLSSTEYGDNVADGFTTNISDDDLRKIAAADGGKAMLVDLNHHLTSGDVHGNEKADANRISKAVESIYGVFTGAGDGVAPSTDLEGNIVVYTNATPEQAAAYVKEYIDDAYPPMSGVTAQRNFFGALEAHKGDAAWLANFYSALGTKTAAKMINQCLTPSFYRQEFSGVSSRYGVDTVNLIKQSLGTMQAGGKLTPEGLNTLLDSIGGDDKIKSYLATEIFAKSDNAELKKMFIDWAGSKGDKTLDAGVMSVLSTMDAGYQEKFLAGLGNNLDSFLKNAMEARRTDFTKCIESMYEENNPISSYPGYPGMEKILGAASKFAPELQKTIFNSVSQELNNGDVFNYYNGNTEFKDNLATLFINNRDALLKDAQVNDKGENSGILNSNFTSGLKKFFQFELLKSPPGKQLDNLKGSVFQLVQDGVTALGDKNLANRNQAAFNDFVTKFGMEPKVYAQILGSVLGCVTDAAGFAQESLNDDAAKKKEAIDFFVGLAFAMIPGAGSSLAKGVTNGIAKHFIEKGAEYFQSHAQDNIQEQIADFLNGKFKDDGSSVTETGDLVTSIFIKGLQDLPNGSSIDGSSKNDQFDFQAEFYQGYDNTSRYTRLDDARKGG